MAAPTNFSSHGNVSDCCTKRISFSEAVDKSACCIEW